jgi:deoxyribodipyrimidine photo-lyase
MRGLFIFRRDLRYQDNIGLFNACKECDEVYAIFILDENQINKNKNEYFSQNAFDFMIESLIELKKTIPLHIYKGLPHEIIPKLCNNIDRIYYNEDYSPYSIKRDKLIEEAIIKHNNKLHDKAHDKAHSKKNDKIDSKNNIIEIKTFTDIPINSPHDIKPYKKFTPYYKVASEISIKPLVKPDITNLYYFNFEVVKEHKLEKPKKNDILRQEGGRKNGEVLLANVKKIDYANTRDYMNISTTRLSPYLKFGVIGIRELARICIKEDNEALLREIYWRDFYIQIGFHFPHVFGSNFRGDPKWKFNKKLFDAWCEGKTGIPIVDAGMRQLNTTGYMHNRCRMIVSNVLTRLFHINWTYGELYFANKLTDYDPFSNNGGWQWSAGTGADAQPYYRIFNPYTQAKKFDPECLYIKKYVEELRDLEPKEIFKIESKLFDYEKERKLALEEFSSGY